jgi:lipoprotein-anchoring transpeptidase ErfK/SrfK
MKNLSRLSWGRLTVGALAAIALPIVTASAAGAATSSSTPAVSTAKTKVLSNETTFTTWSEANYAGAIRSAPSNHARSIARLRFGTPDGLGLQVYILLSQRSSASGTWVKLRIPGRPNGRTGWVPRGALSGYEVVHTELIVNRAARRLTLFRNGKAIFHAPVGVGKPSTPTPPGHFWITEAFSSNVAAYGPYAFGTTDYSNVETDWPGGGVVGLHGTDEPSLVPGDPSHGCIRLHNSDILRLKKLLPIGTPLWIQ